MISFLAPIALIGLATLAVPVAIHLLKPRRVRVVPFSSLRWLRASQHRLSRRIQWHQVLLFLLRAAILTLLVLAAARPILLRRGTNVSTHRFVIIDTGRAMNSISRHDSDPMTKARRIAGKILAEAGPDRQTTVLVAAHSPRALGPLSSDPGRYVERVRNLVPEGSENPVSSVLRLIPSLRRNADPADSIEIFFITANLASSWVQTDIAAFMREVDVPVRVQILDVSPRDPQNAWIASAEVRESGDRSLRRLRVQLGAVGNRKQTRTLRLSGISGIPDSTRDVTLIQGHMLWQEFELSPTLDIENQTALLTLEPSDDLSDDDRFWVRLRPRGQHTVLVVEPDSTHIRELRPAFHLQMALDTLSEAMPGRFSLQTLSVQALQEADLAAADLIFLVEPPFLSESILTALRDRVSGGAGLIVFLGPATHVDFYNQNLFNPLQPGEGLMTRPLGNFVNMRESRHLARLSGMQWGHPILNPFVDPSYGDLAVSGFSGYLQLPESTDSGRERILAFLPDGTPAIIESAFGAGRVLLLNTTANDVWSDLPRRRGFVPLLDSMITYLTGPAGIGQFHVGDPLRLALPSGAQEPTVQFLDTQGIPLRMEVQQQGGRRVVQIAAVFQPGIYTLTFHTTRGDAVNEPVVVQSGRSHSALTAMDNAVLQSWWTPASFAAVLPEKASDSLHTSGGRRVLEEGLLWLAILALMTETVMCCLLCPRAKPLMVSDSVVSRRGFFNHLEEPLREDAPEGETTTS